MRIAIGQFDQASYEHYMDVSRIIENKPFLIMFDTLNI